jgi:hypothetical protein
MIEAAENVNPPRLTYSVQLDLDEHAIVNLVSMRINEALDNLEEEFQKAKQEKAAKELEDKRIAKEQDKTKEQELVLVRGKDTFVDTTPVASPIRTSREFRTSSSRMDPEIREMFNIHQAHIASLIESDQRKEQTMAQILNMLCDI